MFEAIPAALGIGSSLFGAFGNSSASDAASAAQAGVSAANQAAQQGVGQATNAINQYGQAALTSQRDALSNAGLQLQGGLMLGNAPISPQATASYSALQQYMNLLGISTPQGGFQQLAQNEQTAAQTGSDILQAIPKFGAYMGDVTGLSQAQIQNLWDAAGHLGDQTKQQTAQNILSGLDQTGKSGMWQAGLETQLSGMESNYQRQQAAQTGINTALANPVAAPNMTQTLSNTPGYQFALQQGLLAANNSFGAQGNALGGNAIAGEQSFAAGLASQTYQNAVANAAQASGMLNPYAAQTAANAYNTYNNLAANTMQEGYNVSQINMGIGSGLANAALTGAGIQANADIAGAGLSANAAIAGGAQQSGAFGGLASLLGGSAGQSLMSGIGSLFGF